MKIRIYYLAAGLVLLIFGCDLKEKQSAEAFQSGFASGKLSSSTNAGYAEQPDVSLTHDGTRYVYSIKKYFGKEIFTDNGEDFHKIVYNGKDSGYVQIHIPFDWCYEESDLQGKDRSPFFKKVYVPYVTAETLNGITPSAMYGTYAKIKGGFGNTIVYGGPIRLSFEWNVNKEIAQGFGADKFGENLPKKARVVHRAVAYLNFSDKLHIRDINLAPLFGEPCYASLDEVDYSTAELDVPIYEMD